MMDELFFDTVVHRRHEELFKEVLAGNRQVECGFFRRGDFIFSRLGHPRSGHKTDTQKTAEQ